MRKQRLTVKQCDAQVTYVLPDFLEPGDCFLFDSELYMIADRAGSPTYNVVNLSTHMVMQWHDFVESYDAVSNYYPNGVKLVQAEVKYTL